MFEFIISVLFTIAEHSILSLFSGFAIAGIIIFIYLKISSSKIKISLRILSVIIFIYSFGNLFAGYILAGSMIYNIGETGSAVTVSIKQTNNQYNHQWVYEHTIVLETKDGKKFETTFSDADFNIFPIPKDGYVYPARGEKYSVKYLKSHPKAFVIVSDDNSPYAKRIRCQDLREVYEEAERKFRIDSLNSGYREKYLKSRDEYNKNGCRNTTKY